MPFPDKKETAVAEAGTRLGTLGRVALTIEVIFCALFPRALSRRGRCPEVPGMPCRGAGRVIRETGEVEVFLPGCLAPAGPALLFRMKREGFSRCRVEVRRNGLMLCGWR